MHTEYSHLHAIPLKLRCESPLIADFPKSEFGLLLAPGARGVHFVSAFFFARKDMFIFVSGIIYFNLQMRGKKWEQTHLESI